MYEYNCINDSNLKNTCLACLRMSDYVREMTVDERNTYKEFVKVTFQDLNMASMHICLFCSHLMKKLGKFVLQCQEANKVLSNFHENGTKSQSYFSPIILSQNLTVSPLQTLDIDDDMKEHFDSVPLSFDDDNVFDDDDVPLVMFKKEEGEKEKRKKKKKVKNRDVEIDNQPTADMFIKTEDMKTDSQEVSDTKTKSKKPQKQLREGFSSRMVQETEEYEVIKLTKEQVLEEMQARAESEQYQRTLFKCTKCVKGFNFEDVLRTHMEKHSMENGSLQCDICSQYCPGAVSLRGHMKSHTTRYRCKVCGCVRGSRQHLLEHHASHTRAAPRYRCNHCEFDTTKRTSMQRHVRAHAARERHACHRCGKLFKSLETLRVHTMRHDASQLPRCSACARVFVYPSLLRAHVRAVHERRDYYCVECDREFKSRENLRLHFKKAKKHRDSSYNHDRSAVPPRCRRHNRSDAPAPDRTYNSKSVLNAQEGAHTQIVHSSDAHCKKLEDTIIPEISPPTLLES